MAAVQIRFDGELRQRLKSVAGQAGISVNQLVNGMLWGAFEKMAVSVERIEGRKRVVLSPAGLTREQRQSGNESSEGDDGAGATLEL